MALKMLWVGNDQLDRVAETRWMCYAHALKDLTRFKEGIHANPWGRPGDYLLAEQNGHAVGTATSYPLTMWVRGAAISCQGVAYVGTIKTARRRGGSEPGVASAVMKETLRAARERGHVVSALMPFRVSYYEHFGYGLVERRSDWTIPLSVLPSADCAGWRFLTPGDRAALAEQWQRSVAAGHCDVERSAKRWKNLETAEEDGMVFIDHDSKSGAAKACAFVTHEPAGMKNHLRIQGWSADSMKDFVGLLSFFGTMRDQFSAIVIPLPADWQINRLLKEAQVPHRIVEHPTATVTSLVRMQLRILDHKKYLEAIHWPKEVEGGVTIGIEECEGDMSRFSVEVESGRAEVTPWAGEPDFQCADRNWAAIATGDLSASDAVRWGLARQTSPAASQLLDALAMGPKPFCREYF